MFHIYLFGKSFTAFSREIVVIIIIAKITHVATGQRETGRIVVP